MTSARFCLFRRGLNVLQNGSEQLFYTTQYLLCPARKLWYTWCLSVKGIRTPHYTELLIELPGSGYILTHPQNLHERMLRRLHTMLWWIISYISHGLAKVRHTKFWVCMKHTGRDKEISYVVFFSFNDIELLILCHSWFKLHYLIMNLCLEFVTNPLVRCHLNLLLRLLYSLLRRFMLLFFVRHRCQWLISLWYSDGEAK